jgi:hypothetical protein
MNDPGPHPAQGGAPPADSPPLPFWDSTGVLVALIVVTIAAGLAAAGIDHAWRPRMEAREAEAKHARQALARPLAPRPAAPTPMEVGPPVSLTDLEPSATPDSPAGGLGRDALPNGGPIEVWGGGTREGIVMDTGASGVASVEYALDGHYDQLVAQPAMCAMRHLPGAGPLTFSAIVDGRVRWSSPPLHLGELDHVAVPVSGGRVLRLEVRCVGDTRPSGPGAWLDARLIPIAKPVGH